MTIDKRHIMTLPDYKPSDNMKTPESIVAFLSDLSADDSLETIAHFAQAALEAAQKLGVAPELRDEVVEANRKLLLDRSRVGISKYGTTLADAGLTRVQLAQHALEEALDLANYLQTIIQTEAAAPVVQAVPEAAFKAIRTLRDAIGKQLDEAWICNSDHPALRAALDATDRIACLAPAPAQQPDLLAEALAVFDLMLDGCNDKEFGDFQNGHGETIGPRMDALHAKLRAAVSGAAVPAVAAAQEPVQPTDDNLFWSDRPKALLKREDWDPVTRKPKVAAPAEAKPVAPTADLAVELQGVADELDEQSGFWRSCSGCYETEDGHPVGRYPYSHVFGCALGGGCSECGGIGAVWDNTDYEAMGRDLMREEAEAVAHVAEGMTEQEQAVHDAIRRMMMENEYNGAFTSLSAAIGQVAQRWDEYRAALAARPAAPSERPQSKLLASIHEAAEIGKNWPSWKTGIQPAQQSAAVPTVDTPEFRALEADFVKATIELSTKDHHADNADLHAARSAMIAHIDAHLKKAIGNGNPNT